MAMNKWGSGSLRALASADPRWRVVADTVLQIKDHSVIQGHRGQEEQDEYFRTERSKVQWPNSKHNTFPSLAIDVQPYPRPWKESDLREELCYLAGLYVGVGATLALNIRWGGTWSGSMSENKFDDLFHLELRND